MRKVKKQSGFTLVEIAIVLVIIGLLLGGVLKGQEIIESSKIKTLAKDLNGATAMFMAYQDRYRGVPGDDIAAAVTTAGSEAPATSAARGWDPIATGNGDGFIGNATANTDAQMFPTPKDESLAALQALRSAGFLPGTGTSKIAPLNAAGGLIGFSSKVMKFGDQNVVCYSGLSGKQAGALDRLLDDGISTSGSVRSASSVSTAAAALAVTAATGDAPYSETTAGVILCKSL